MQRLSYADLVVLHGRMTDASFERFLAASMKSIDERDDDERVALLHDVQDPVLVDGKWRRKLRLELKKREDKLARTRPAHALVSESPLLRSALKVVHWVAPPKYPHRVVSTVAEPCALRPVTQNPAPAESVTGRILVVDDQGPVRNMLQALGHTVVTAEGGESALQALARDGGVRCILVDLTMPGDDGAKVFARIRAQHPAIPVIFMSGYEAVTVPEAEGFLHKPPRLDELRRALRRVLEAQQRPRGAHRDPPTAAALSADGAGSAVAGTAWRLPAVLVACDAAVAACLACPTDATAVLACFRCASGVVGILHHAPGRLIGTVARRVRGCRCRE